MSTTSFCSKLISNTGSFPDVSMALIPPPPPPQPQQQASGHHHSLEYLPRPLGDETIDAHLKFNPYRLTIMEMCYLGLIVVGAGIWADQLAGEDSLIFGVIMTLIIYSVMVGWGAFLGRISWGLIAKWSVRGWLLKVWKWPFWGIFNPSARKIRIDSYVIEHKPSGLQNNLVFTVKQSWTASLFLFTLLFLSMPEDLTNQSTYYGLATLLILFAPALSGLLVPLYIYSDSSVVEVIPGARDFAPIGMSMRQLLRTFIGLGSVVIVVLTVFGMARTEGFVPAMRFVFGDVLMALSIMGATVLAAALSYSNKLHLQWVEAFNQLWFDPLDPDHTFHAIDDNAYIVMPDHLLLDTLTHLRNVRGSHFADAPAPMDIPPPPPQPTVHPPPAPGSLGPPPPPG